MKKIILAMCLLTAFSCQNEPPVVVQEIHPTPVPVKPKKYKTVVLWKHIKDLKEITEQHTDEETKVNWTQTIWEGDLKTTIVPNVSTTTKYFIIFTDNTHEEVDRDSWLNYSKGDSINKSYQLEI